MSDFTRVGVAFTKPQGETQRRREYGILRGSAGSLYTRYEGYREGSTQVGLPLAGVHASWRQPLIPFVEAHFETVRFF